jgi:aminoglycoside phosphotransferase (APT) family kinase protein
MTAAASPTPDEVAGLLTRRHPSVVDVAVSPPERVFGGNARLAWSCEATWTEDGARHIEPLILLVRAAGSQVTTDPSWEVAVLVRLSGQDVRAPKVWAQDLAGELLGAPAVLLQRLPGQADPVAYLNADPAVGRPRTLDLARAAAELHAADPTGLSAGEPLVDGWRDRFLACRLEPHPTVSWLFDWLADHTVTPAHVAVVHGDLRPGNVLYDGDRIVGLLDWEMAHVGDPVEDLAWAYRALWSPERFVPLDEFVRAYESAGGSAVKPDALRWHRVFAEVKYATISLQAARAVVDGRSHNLRLIDRARTVAPALARCLDWLAEARLAESGRAGQPC